ncbi:hypothetical protein OHC33_000668 [Knufia fluminis]|uniref:F-box domain-containing protein n=1 Tax=Knufia fluminis TaxID=191047 RepID=A0AAN8EQR8_9EURO|nr:hypothetical protein OHC33_000668 [Knufia fluminis]
MAYWSQSSQLGPSKKILSALLIYVKLFLAFVFAKIVYPCLRPFRSSQASADTPAEGSLPEQSNEPAPIATQLPIEVWQRIADHLAVEDAVCLSLCTKNLYDLVGKKKTVLGRLIFDDEARMSLLRILHRDMNPTLMLCEACIFIHPVPQREEGYECYRSKKRKCKQVDDSESSGTWFQKCFGFGDVQVAAELYRRGDQTALEEYLQQLSAQQCNRFGQNFVIDFRVKVAPNGRVYIRKQEWYPLLNQQWINMPTESSSLDVCIHMAGHTFRLEHAADIDTAEKSIRHLKVLQCLRSQPGLSLNEQSTWGHLPLRRCKYCPTEYRLDFGVLSETESTIVLTKWMCLGEGKTRADDLWIAHFSHKYGNTATYQWEQGAILEAFGDGEIEQYRPEWSEDLEKVWKKRSS